MKIMKILVSISQKQTEYRLFNTELSLRREVGKKVNSFREDLFGLCNRECKTVRAQLPCCHLPPE